MKKNKPTPEQFAVALETIKGFSDDYQYATHSNISFDVWCICAIDERFGLSDNQKQVILKYLERGREVVDAVYLLSDPAFIGEYKQKQDDFPVDQSKIEEIRKALDKLIVPFWSRNPTDDRVKKRQAQEKYPDIMALSDVDKEYLQSIDIGLGFFMKYGLKESLELLDNLFACYEPFKGLGGARKLEIANFYRSLKELLTATYLQASDRWEEQEESKEVKGGVHEQ